MHILCLFTLIDKHLFSKICLKVLVFHTRVYGILISEVISVHSDDDQVSAAATLLFKDDINVFEVNVAIPITKSALIYRWNIVI